jgi:hypothetical protein
VIVLRDADEPIGRISVSHLDECEHRWNELLYRQSMVA